MTPGAGPRRSRRRAAAVTLLGGHANVLLSTVGGLVLVPLYLNFIGARLYGAWLGSGGILAWLAVLDLGLASVMIQRIAGAHGRGEHQSIGRYLSVGLLLQLLMVVLMIGSAALAATWFPAWMDVRGVQAQQLRQAFILASVANGANIINNGVVGFLRALQITVLPNAISLAGTVFWFAVTLAALLSGYGLLAIPAGLLAASLLQLVVNAGYARRIYRAEVRAPLRPDRATARDFLRVSGSLLVSKLGGAAMNRSDTTLIAIFLRPEIAAAYALTRRAADVVLRLLDRFGAAAFAGFAHLAAGDERRRAGEVHEQIMHVYLGSGALLVAAYFAANASFVRLWVGPEYYLGHDLTVLVGLAVLTGGASSLLNYLLGGTGRIEKSAYITLFESLLRLPLMLLLLMTLGVAGLPMAVLLTAIASGAVSRRATFRELGIRRPGIAQRRRSLSVEGMVLVLGGLVGWLWQPASWPGLVLLLGVSSVSLAALLLVGAPAFLGAVAPWARRGARRDEATGHAGVSP